jgi:hypothetical protein
MSLVERKDLNVFIALLETLEKYVAKFPRTETSKLLEKCINKGVTVVPKDIEKLKILEDVLLSDKPVPSKVQFIKANLNLLNV